MTFARSITSALFACSLLAAADSKTVDKTLPLPLTGSVSLESHNGSIQVSTWDRPQIEIHARIEMNSGFQDMEASRRRYEGTRVDIDTSGNSVVIKSKFPEWNNFSGSNPEIHYTINAPRTANWTIRDHNSRIEVRELHAALSIFTHNSRIIVTGLAGAFKLDTHNSDAKVAFSSLTAPSQVDMHNGDVELLLPSSSRFDLQTSSHNARVHSDFPVTTRGTRNRGSDLEGKVNGGGPSLRLNSHNGSFRIRAS